MAKQILGDPADLRLVVRFLRGFATGARRSCREPQGSIEA
jgi:hypothetical protein